MLRRMTRERYLSESELSLFLAVVRERRHVHQARDYAFFALLANTGIRPSEARKLRAKDCSSKRIALPREQRPHGPQSLAWLPLHPKIGEIVRRFVKTLEPGELLFPFSKRQSARLYHYYASKAGISPPRKVYALRHSVGMRLWTHTKDLRLIQAIMGHTRIKAAGIYSHHSPATVSRACVEVL